MIPSGATLRHDEMGVPCITQHGYGGCQSTGQNTFSCNNLDLGQLLALEQ